MTTTGTTISITTTGTNATIIAAELRKIADALDSTTGTTNISTLAKKAKKETASKLSQSVTTDEPTTEEETTDDETQTTEEPDYTGTTDEQSEETEEEFTPKKNAQTKSTTPTLEDVIQACQAHGKAIAKKTKSEEKGRESVKKILGRFGVKKSADLTDTQRAEVIKALQI